MSAPVLRLMPRQTGYSTADRTMPAEQDVSRAFRELIRTAQVFIDAADGTVNEARSEMVGAWWRYREIGDAILERAKRDGVARRNRRRAAALLDKLNVEGGAR